MFDTAQKKIVQKAVLVCVDTGEFDAEVSVDELEELAQTAGAEVIARAIQKRADYDGATCIGRGKFEEIKELIGEDEDVILIFDHELTGSQLKNIEDITGLAVIDRTMLILDIFAQRAVTGEVSCRLSLHSKSTDCRVLWDSEKSCRDSAAESVLEVPERVSLNLTEDISAEEYPH